MSAYPGTSSSSKSPAYILNNETGEFKLYGEYNGSKKFPIIGESYSRNNNTYYPYEEYTQDGVLYTRYLLPYTINKPFGGYETLEVAPTLYRDTEITLTWEYFGFEKNLYKPAGYPNGIYLWNPRSWDENNIKFTFNELLACGTQYVLYPCFEPQMYKIYTANNFLGLAKYYSNGSASSKANIYNPGIFISQNMMTRENETNYNDNYYGMSINGEITSVNDVDFGFNTYSANDRISPIHYGPNGGLTFAGYKKYRETILNDTHQAPELNLQVGDTLLYDVSKYRTAYCPAITYGAGNEYDGRTTTYYAYKLKDYYVDENNVYRKYVEITDNLNLKQFSGSPEENLTMSGYARGTIYGIKSFYQNMLIHYFVPVPKGMYYVYNGTSLRIPENGLFDLLTGAFC